ncbi:MAG: DUF222 domain-containing protein [bacterium]|nr:DUF222 domain-containing protein [bacterium]
MTDPTLFGDIPDAASPSVLGVDGLGVGATSGGGGRRGARETACAGRGAGVVATSSNGIRSGVSEGTAGSDGVRTAASPGSPGNEAVGRIVGGDVCVGVSGGVESPGNEAVGRIVGRFEALVAGLRSLEGELLEERLGLVGRCEAGLAALRSETVAELARRDGEAKAAEAVKDRLRQSRGSAKRDVKLAGQLADLPGTAQALAGGAITPQHARIIAEASEHTDVDEAELLAAAASEPTDTFGHTVRNHVNEKSAEVDLQERRRRQRARRELSIRQQSDGMWKLFGLFDPVAGARIETALTAAERKLRNAEDPANRATVPQRYADALEQLATGNGAAGSQSTTLLVIADYDAVAGQISGAHLPDRTPVTADELVKLAVKAKVVPAIFDTPGRPLWLGRASRDANAAQRIALAARDRHCVGCRARHNICEPHHEVYWRDGGPTDIDNLCLLCGDCHHNELHDKGADIEKAADGKRTLRHAARRRPPNVGHPHGNNTTHRRRGGADSTVNQPLRL